MSKLFFDESPTHGAKASNSGKTLEVMFEAQFRVRKIPIIEDNKELHSPQFETMKRTDKILIRQFKSSHNYSKIDFLYKDFAKEISLPIECKNQIGQGTADQKLSYAIDKLYLAGTTAFWLVIGGKGWNRYVLKAVTQKIIDLNEHSNTQGRLIHAESSLYRAVENLIERGQIFD